MGRMSVLNEAMIEEGYAWAYDGGTKKKDFEELREIRAMDFSSTWHISMSNQEQYLGNLI